MNFPLPLVSLLTCVLAIAAPVSGVVNIRYDAKVPTLEFATSELTNALHAAKQQTEVTTFDQNPAENGGWTVIVGLQERLKLTNPELAKLKLSEEGFAIHPSSKKKLIYVVGADARGAMYGELDVTERIEMGGKLSDIKAKTEKPAMPIRSLKINMPGWAELDLKPEDMPEWEWLLGEDYWRSYFRMMARNRYNISTIWHEHPYAWMVRIPKYPEATMLNDADLERFHKAFTFIFAEAARHGIDTYIITWNIHYPPSFAKAHKLQQYGGSDTPVVRDYMREAIKAVLREYPGLTGVGTCPGETMAGSAAENEAWIMDTYVPAIMEVRGPQKFIHRYWGSEPKPMQEVFAAHYPGKTYLDLKYNGESMYSSPKPHFVDPVWLNQKPRDYEILWHLRNDDIYIYRWGDAGFARALLENCVGPGIAGYVTGSEYERPGPDRLYTDYGKEYQTWTQDFEKHWYRFMLWGKLGYNLNLPDSYFRQVFATRFGPQFGPKLLQIQTTASKIIPLVDSFHWNYMNFDWAAEACMNPNPIINTARDGKGRRPNYRELGQPSNNFNNIREWIFNWTIDDEEFIGIPEYIGNLLAGVKKGPGEEKKQSPEDVANSLDRWATEIDQGLKGLTLDPSMPAYKEAVSWVWDLQMLAYLGHYYAEKTRGGTDLLYYWCTGDTDAQQRAIASLTKAKGYWLELTSLGDKIYKMPKTSIYPDLQWSKYLKDVDDDIAFAKGGPAFKSRTAERTVTVPKFSSPLDVEKFEKQIVAGLDPLKENSSSVEITQIDVRSSRPFDFWIETMTNRKAGYINMRKASGGADTGIGYFTYPMYKTDKVWCILANDLGSVDKIWYGGKVLYDVKKQGAEILRKGLVFRYQANNGPLTVRCDGVKGQMWGCMLRHEYKDTFTLTTELRGAGTIDLTVTNNFPGTEIKDLKLNATPWADGWQVTPSNTTLNVADQATAQFTVTQGSSAQDWSGVTLQAEYRGEQRSTGIFPDVPGLNIIPVSPQGDGLWRTEMIDGKWAMLTEPENDSMFIYFNVRDSFLKDIDKDVVLSIDYYDTGEVQPLTVHYDSAFDEAAEGTWHEVVAQTKGVKGWQNLTVTLPRARFANRENYSADFRLSGPSSKSIESGPNTKPLRVGKVEIANQK
jgi:hypothetical protein